MSVWVVLTAAMALGAFGFSILYFRASARVRALETDLENQSRALQEHVSQAPRVAQASGEAATLDAVVTSKRSELADLERRLDELRTALVAVEEELEVQSFGFYRPTYGFDDSSQYKARLDEVRAEQKRLIKEGHATECPTNVVVDGSAARGRKMVREQSKLMLRAFNGECDAAVAKVKYNNITKLQSRVEKSFDAINTLGASKQVSITSDYLRTKLDELRLVHEHREKVAEEKEIQRELREQMREEQKAEKELQKATADAEKDERLRQEALEAARAELAAATAEQHERLQAAVAKLESELSAAIDRKAKAIARAQLTRAGHVYVISNIGSFGEGVYKIGLTRRFDPLVRVKELGDASVPFPFDVHAVIYSEDAPALEAALHREFDARRVNKVNNRKEYFRVTLEEIRQAVARHFGIITFVLTPEAEQFRKTLAIEQEATRPDAVEVV
ncbi:MAG: DUF4041 domain-containing protein [Parvibaculum sp.]